MPAAPRPAPGRRRGSAPIARALAAALMLAGPAARADEVSDALRAAIAAWEAGEAGRAKEEIDYAAALIAQRKAEGLAAFLPAALPGWTRADGDGAMAAAAMFGGGAGAAARYARAGATVEIELMADNPMAAALGALLANPALAAMQGALRRKGRQSYLVDPAGDISALVANRVLVRVTGDAPPEDRLAYFEAIELEALGRF